MYWTNIVFSIFQDDLLRSFKILILVAFLFSTGLFFLKKHFKKAINLSYLHLGSVAIIPLFGVLSASFAQFIKFYDLSSAVPQNQLLTHAARMNYISYTSLLMALSFVFIQILLLWSEGLLERSKKNA